MDASATVDGKTLFYEIARYLETVDLFRAERCEPKWLPEPLPAFAHASEQRETVVASRLASR